MYLYLYRYLYLHLYLYLERRIWETGAAGEIDCSRYDGVVNLIEQQFFLGRPKNILKQK